MQCPICNAFIEEETVFCGNCGRQVKPQHAPGATIDYLSNLKVGEGSYSALKGTGFTLPENTIPASASARSFTPFTPPQGNTPPPVSSVPPSRNRSGRRLAVIAAIVLLVLAGGIVLILALVQRPGKTSQNTALAANAQGQIAFVDSTTNPGQTDALKISLTGLQSAPAGSEYDAWLINAANEQVQALGKLRASGSTFTLNFTNPARVNLLSLGDQIIITLEKGQARLPGGQTVLSATFPPKAFVHIKHLLFSFPTTPGKIGLLVGLLAQTKLLSGQAQVLQGVEANQNAEAQKCIAQSILDILEGLTGSDYSDLPASCGSTAAVGDGFGILGTNGYASVAAQHAALAATQTDATPVIHQHASEVEIATTNITTWLTTIQKDALKLLNGQADKAAIDEIATLAQQANLGVDANGNGQIEPITNEAGATTAYLSGQLMATLNV